MIKERIITDVEYKDYFVNLAGIRSKIAKILPVVSGSLILDLATGYGYFSLALSHQYPDISILGIDICGNDVKRARENIQKAGMHDKIKIKKMDATNLDLAESSFDAAVNFLGLEDIHMTRGRSGVRKTFQECYRILKPGGLFAFVVMPPEEMETEAQKTEVELFSYLCGAKWLSKKDYRIFLENNGFKESVNYKFRTGKKLSAAQAKEEIKFACEHVQKLYGVKTKSFDEVWKKFGSRIENYGLGQYSNVLLMIAQRGD